VGNRWLWALGLLLVLATGAVYFWLQPQPLAAQAATRVLVLGLDEVENRSRSDTIIVAQVDEQGVVLLSIPRDLRVKFPDGQLRKINAAFSLGSASGGLKKGAELARKVVADFLGIALPYYVVVDFDGFKKAVDQIGGVDVDVERSMDYDDDAQNLHIHFEPGVQRLDGQQALEYVRYRDGQGDLKRIQRQQQLIKAILEKQNAQFNAFDKLKSLLELALRDVTSNMTLPNLVSLARQLQGFDFEEVVTLSLSGDTLNLGGVSYLEPRIVDTATKVDRWLRRKRFLLPGDVRVVVLNGVGKSGLAGDIRDALKQRGVQVDYAGNAENFDYKNTLVVMMQDDDKKAKLVSSLLGGVGQVVHHEITAVNAHLLSIQQMCEQNALCPPDLLDRADVVLIAGQDFPR